MGQFSYFCLLIFLPFLSSPDLSSSEDAILKVPIYLENNAQAAKQVTLIWYSPFRFGNSTEQVRLEAGAQIQRKYAVGTKLYVASEEQVGLVMGGGRIDEEVPFLKIRSKYRNKSYPLFPEPKANR